MRLNELHQTRQYNDRSFGDVVADFIKAGGQVDSGKYGTALIHPSWNYVFKVFSNDPCYLRFVRWVMRNPLPGFPKFYGRIRKIVPFYKRPVAEKFLYVVKMERLYPIADRALKKIIVQTVNFTCSDHFWETTGAADFEERLAKFNTAVEEYKAYRKGIDLKVSEKMRSEIDSSLYYVVEILRYFQKWPSLRDVCYANWQLMQARIKCSPDNHDGNFMQRENGEIVFIDPLWEGESFWQMQNDAMRAEMDYDGPTEEELADADKYEMIRGGKLRPPKRPKPPKSTWDTTSDDIPF